MRRLVVLIAVMMLLVPLGPTNLALALTPAEKAEETSERYMGLLPAPYGDESGIDGINSYGVEKHLSLYEIGALCQNNGGYYYWVGAYYWYDCANMI